MIEMKIFLMLLIWPEGQDQSNPLWSTVPFVTVAECQESAAKAIEEASKIYGDNVQTEFHCLSRDSRIKE